MYKFYRGSLGATSVYSIYIKDMLGRRVTDARTGKPIFYLSKNFVEPMPLPFPIAETPMCATSYGGGQVVDASGKRVCFTPKYTPNPNINSIYSTYSIPSPAVAPPSVVVTPPPMVIDTTGPLVADTPTPVVTVSTPPSSSVPAPRPITPVLVPTTTSSAPPDSTPTPTFIEEVEEETVASPPPSRDNAKLVVGGILALVIVGGVVAYSMKGKKK